MVLLTIKGTKYPDEFVVERGLDFDVATGSAQLCRIQNARHVVRLMLFSASELVEEAKTAADMDLIPPYKALVENLGVRLKDSRTPVRDAEYEEAAAAIRAQTTNLFPSYCTHKDGTDAAIQELYAMHENPDLDEGVRLIVYHCRAILDPQWKINEMTTADTAALWFCGKVMEGTLRAYCGRNEKSRLTVKVARRDGPAPSGEPRMRYEDQRELFRCLREKREVFKSLEMSELRDRVVRQSRGQVVLPLSVATGPTLCGARPLYPQTEERVVPVE